jgi:UDP-glucose 4-epimerase
VNAVVTGGLGFIGAHLVEALLRRGHAVAIIDRAPARAIAPDAALHRLDVCCAADLERALAAARPEVVFHLAAQVDVGASVASPGPDAEVNLLGVVNVLQAARRVGARRVVLTSTAAVYGDARALPTAEDAPVAPLSPYAQAKHAAEGYCTLYERLFGLSTVSLRLANVYGPRRGPGAASDVVTALCRRCLDGLAPVVCGDGRQTRDFVEVADVVRALQLAGDAQAGGPINIGTGRETSILELAARVQALVTGAAGPAALVAPRAGEVRRSCLAAGRARRELGWRPRVALEAGLGGVIEALLAQRPAARPRGALHA